jgi:hypothetical protein
VLRVRQFAFCCGSRSECVTIFFIIIVFTRYHAHSISVRCVVLIALAEVLQFIPGFTAAHALDSSL